MGFQFKRSKKWKLGFVLFCNDKTKLLLRPSRNLVSFYKKSF